MGIETTARRVTIDRPNQLLKISWADEHESLFPLDGLRRTCPCASCAGGHDRMGGLPDRQTLLAPAQAEWEKVRVEPVGRYALRILWDDGHSAGIYSWERLRSTCPCDLCA